MIFLYKEKICFMIFLYEERICFMIFLYKKRIFFMIFLYKERICFMIFLYKERTLTRFSNAFRSPIPSEAQNPSCRENSAAKAQNWESSGRTCSRRRKKVGDSFSFSTFWVMFVKFGLIYYRIDSLGLRFLFDNFFLNKIFFYWLIK